MADPPTQEFTTTEADEPRLLGGRYRLGQLIGHGGMAEVYLARDVRLGRDVAIKVLRTDLARDPTFQARFRREAQSAAALNHPMVVAVYDTGEDESVTPALPYIVMEYVDGRTLREVLHTEGRLLPQRALEIVADVCAALSYSHGAGIVHRDIKPGNVMLTRDGRVKVMDFGIARAVAATTATVTQTAAVMGTAQYLSPEQARGESVDARSDIYSTGVLLYELLTGQPPFRGDSPVAVAYQHVREDPQPPSLVEPDLTGDIDAVVLKSLAKHPGNRYQSAAEMREDLLRAAAGRPVLATPVLVERGTNEMPAAVPPPARRGRRRGLLYALLALLILAALVGVGFLAHSLLSRPRMVTVPSVINQTQDQAVRTLEDAGLRPGQIKTQESQLTPGTVLDQNPKSGARAEEDDAIDLTVSIGPGTRVIPDVTGKSEADAKAQLSGMQLIVTVTETADPSRPVGQVISTDPAAGTTVPSGSTVRLTVVSSQVPVPDVVGRSLKDAQSALSDLGLSATVQPGGDTSDNAKVSGQAPAAGSLIARGGSVRLQTLPKPSPSPSPSPKGKGKNSPSPSASPSH